MSYDPFSPESGSPHVRLHPFPTRRSSDLLPGPTPASTRIAFGAVAEMVGRSLVPVMANDTVVAADAPCVSRVVEQTGDDQLPPHLVCWLLLEALLSV